MEEEICVEDSYLQQNVAESTRKQTILELVICNEIALIKYVVIQDPRGNSDHHSSGAHAQCPRFK